MNCFDDISASLEYLCLGSSQIRRILETDQNNAPVNTGAEVLPLQPGILKPLKALNPKSVTLMDPPMGTSQLDSQ